MTRQEDIVQESVSEAKDSTKGARRLVILLGLMSVLLLMVAGTVGWLAYDQTRTQAESGTNLATAVKEACEDPERREELGGLCPSADEVIEEGEKVGIPVPGPQGEQGEEGRPPSQSEVLAAVALYCNEGLCDGEDGANVTPQQVASAVAAYCNDRGECRGRTGTAGEDGTDGEQGPPPTPEQVSAAVANFCGESNCDGPQGPVGPAGPAGQDGTNGEDGVDAVPFTFSFTVPGDNPAMPDYRYTIRCTEQNSESCEVTREEVSPIPD